VERASIMEHMLGKPQGDPAVRGAIGMELIGKRQLGEIALAIEHKSIEEMQIRVAGLALPRDALQLLTDGGQRQLSRTAIGGVARCAEQHFAGSQGIEVECTRARRVLMNGAVERRDHQQRRGRMPIAKGVQARKRIRSVFTRLMPILMLSRSAGVSRITRAVN
jgi:hypothetical protein